MSLPYWSLLVLRQTGHGKRCTTEEAFHLHYLDTLLYDKATLFEFKDNYNNFSNVRIFWIFTIVYSKTSKNLDTQKIAVITLKVNKVALL